MGGVSLAEAGKKGLSLKVEERLRTQTEPRDLHYFCAACCMRAVLDYMVQKRWSRPECPGCCRCSPALGDTQAERVNLDRMRANAIEAAEQCGILTLPEVVPPVDFRRLLEARDPRRWFRFCEEDAAQSIRSRRLLPSALRTGPCSRWPSLSGPKGALPTRSAPRCSSSRTRYSSRSALASSSAEDTAAAACPRARWAVPWDWQV